MRAMSGPGGLRAPQDTGAPWSSGSWRWGTSARVTLSAMASWGLHGRARRQLAHDTPHTSGKDVKGRR
jgi:hypothetical protein